MDITKIDWCDSTWNPVTGCLHGCEYCYARSIANRFGGWSFEDVGIFHDELFKNDSQIRELEKPLMICSESDKWRNAPYPYDFIPTLHRYKLDEPQKWKKGRNIFVCSMADLFGEWVPDSWIEEVFTGCEKAPQHNYLFLTKNPKRYIELENDKKMPWYSNFWFGTTITNKKQEYTWFTEKKFHWFLSIEPIFEDLGKMGNFPNPEWIIVGAETGRRKDKVIPKREWIENIVNECRKNSIPVFMKESLAEIWGEPLIQEMPEKLRK